MKKLSIVIFTILAVICFAVMVLDFVYNQPLFGVLMLIHGIANTALLIKTIVYD